MALLKVFKSHMPSLNYLFKEGTPAAFQQGVYRTEKPAEIEQLEAEVANGNSYFYIDPNDFEIESSMLDPIVALKARLRDEILAELAAEAAATAAGTADLGNSEQKSIAPASTVSLSANKASLAAMQAAVAAQATQSDKLVTETPKA